jgi:hypothetical protein
LTKGAFVYNSTTGSSFFVDQVGFTRCIEERTYWTSSNSNVWTFSNVGINTTAPKVDLDVYGEISSSNLVSYRHIYGDYGTFWRNDGNTLSLFNTNANDQYGSFDNNRPFYYFLGSGQVVINQAIMVDNPPNSVGLTSTSINSGYRNTTDSNYALWVSSRGDWVQGSNDSHRSIVVTGGGDYRGDGGGIHFNVHTFSFWRHDSMAYIRGVCEGVDKVNARNAGGLAFHVRECLTFAMNAGSTNAAKYTEAMRITHDANVGIGTNSPKTKLQVEGETRTWVLGVYNDEGAASSRSFIRINNSVTSMNSVIGSAINNADWAYGSRPEDLVIANYSLTQGILLGNANEKAPDGAIGLYVTRENDVGIGTTTPDVKFQVEGDGMMLYNKIDNRPRFYMYNGFRPQRPYIMASCASNNDFIVGSTPGDSVLGTTDEQNSLLIGHCYNTDTGFGINKNAVICCAPNYCVGIGGILNPGVTLDVNGAVRGTGFITASDERLKEEIVLANIEQCYNNIKNLPLKYYKWRDDIQPYDTVQDRHRLGWIAQDVQTIFPKAVHVFDSYGIKDMLSLDTNQIVASMYGAIQKLQEIVEADKQAIADLQAARIADKQAIADLQAARIADKQAIADLQAARIADKQAIADLQAKVDTLIAAIIAATPPPAAAPIDPAPVSADPTPAPAPDAATQA